MHVRGGRCKERMRVFKIVICLGKYQIERLHKGFEKFKDGKQNKKKL